MAHVGAEAAYAHAHGLVFVVAQLARELEEPESLFKGDCRHGLALQQRRESRLGLGLAVAYLHYRTEAAYLHAHGLACGRVGAEMPLAEFRTVGDGQRRVDRRVELAVEAAYLAVPRQASVSYLVEDLLHVGREVVVEDIGEVDGQEVVDYHAYVRGHELALVRAGVLCAGLAADAAVLPEGEGGVVARSALVLAALHVSALLDGGDGRGVGRRAAYAELLHLVHQRCFGVARRMLGEALGGLGGAECQAVALAEDRQYGGVGLFGGVVVMPFGIHAQEALELYHLACGGECRGQRAGADFYSSLLDACVGHLRSYGSLSDECVEFLFLCGGVVDDGLVHVGGTYGLVRFLGALRRGVELAHVQIFVAERVAYLRRYGGDGFVRQVERVRTHVCYVTVLVQMLGHHHRLRYREAQLAGGLLL